MAVRRASVAGTFYPADPAKLKSQVEGLLSKSARRPARAVLVPHAGYDFSGAVAGDVFGRVAIPRDVVLLCFSHRGRGPAFAVWPEGAWETPLGRVDVPADLVARLKAALPQLEDDDLGFHGEHSGEVQLPFLQVARPDVRVVPISINSKAGLEAFGWALAGAVEEALVVATTDLNHVGDAYGIPIAKGMTAKEFANGRDGPILDAIRRLELDGLLKAAESSSMCGVAPTGAFIAFGKACGATAADVIAYATSADADPGDDRAVGYPGAIIW